MIKYQNVTKNYGKDVVALNKISLQIKPGEFVSIVGQSGTGKTTIVKTLIGEEKIDKGKITVGGWDITNLGQGDVHVLRRQIGVIFQDFKLLEKKTIFENVAFAMEVCGEKYRKIRKIVPHVLKIVGLHDKMNRYPKEISGGEQQRVAIARALVHRPKILLADEPTGNLDTLNTAEIIELLLRINKFGTTIVLVTHDKDVVNRLRKRVITIDGGMIIGDQVIGKYVL